MRYDFIEAFTDIDDDLIACALPEAQKAAKLKPKKRPLWKPFAAAAACLAVIGIAFGVITAVKSRQDELGALDDMSWVAEGYPAEAKYKYEGDFSELELVRRVDDVICRYGGVNGITAHANFSELIVVGTFVDDARQDISLNEKPPAYTIYDGHSYNKLRVDRVIKGDVEVGEELMISSSYWVNDGRLFAHSLTPMIKGEQWIYFLSKPDKDTGYYSAAADDRYPVPGNENIFVLTGSTHGVFDEADFSERCYGDVKKIYNNKLDVNKLTKWEYDGKVYNVMNYSGEIADGVNFYVGTTKDTYKDGAPVEALAVIENTSDKDVTLYMGNSGGTDFLYGSSLAGVSDGCEGTTIYDTAEGRSIDSAISYPVVRAGETRYQKIRFKIITQDNLEPDAVFFDLAPAGYYDGKITAVVVDEINRPKTMRSIELDYSINLEYTEKFSLVGTDYDYEGKTYKIVNIGSSGSDGSVKKEKTTAIAVRYTDDRDMIEVLAIIKNEGSTLGLLCSENAPDTPVLMKFVPYSFLYDTSDAYKDEVFNVPSITLQQGEIFIQKASFPVAEGMRILTVCVYDYDIEEYAESGTLTGIGSLISGYTVDFSDMNDTSDVLELFGITYPWAQE